MSLDKKNKELLQKLIAGTISDKEQWQLERASLDDPFLADALEGYHLHETSEEDLALIKKKLSAKSNSTIPKTRTLLWKRLSIAASLLVLLSASFWMFQTSSSSDLKTTAESNKKVQLQAPAPTDPTYQNEKEKTESSELRVKELITDQNKTTQENEIDILPEAKSKVVTPVQEKIIEIKEVPQSTPPAAAIETIEERIPAGDNIFSDEEQLAEEVIIENRKAEAEAKEDFVVTAEGKPIENATSKAKKQTESKWKKKKQAFDDSDPLANAGPLEAIPSIAKGVVLNKEGNPMPGVEILDIDKNKLGETDAAGNFFLPDMNGYVITSFAGYDSMTVAITPNLSIQLQESSKSLTQPLKRLVDMMDTGELRSYYVNELNVLFSKHWPICTRNNNFEISQQNGLGQQLKNNTTIHIVISDNGKIYDTTFYDELEESCASKILDLIKSAEAAELFVAGRPTNFTYRINF